MPCLFRLLTGFYCPGCGGTRALWALLSGHPLLSFLYHPLVPYSALTAVWLLGPRLLYRRTGKEKYRRELTLPYVYFGIGLIVLNFLIKNILLARGIDVLAMLPGSI